MNRIALLGVAALALTACDAQDAPESEATAPVAEEAALAEAAAPAPAPSSVPAADCDRACLTGLVTEYLDALVAGDPSSLPVAQDVRFTEDQVERQIGEGLWTSEVALTDYRLDIIDVREGVAASLAKVEENGTPVLLALRLLTEGGRIEGVETMVVRTPEEGMIFQIDAIQTLSEAMAYMPAPEQRNTREQMIDAAVRYPEGLKVGSFVTSDVPFAEDAYRFENGQLMAGPGCTFLEGCDQIKTQRIPTLAEIEYHVAAVDEEQGVVLIRMDFGPGSVFPSPDRPDGQSLSVFEAFKVYDG
jgi:hypothetical protein